MKTVPWPIFLTVVYMFLTVQCVPDIPVSGSSSIASFVVTSLINDSWVKDAIIDPSEDVLLECTTAEASQDNVDQLDIKRADGVDLAIQQAKDIKKNAQSLVMILRSVECIQMGTYVCEIGRGDKKTVDLGIYGCPPQPCKDQSTDINLYISVNETKQFYVCVEAFPNVSSLAYNGKEVGFDLSNDILPGMSCTTTKLEDVFSAYNISCQIKVGGEIDYGANSFSISNSNGLKQNQRVSFALHIEMPGPPECPTGIISTNQGTNFVTLSWKPGNNRGANQSFIVFYKDSETETWQNSSNVLDIETNITGLQSDKDYEFNVVAVNLYSLNVSENMCNKTIVEATEPESTTPSTTTTSGAQADNVGQDGKEALNPIVIIVLVLAFVVVIAVVVGLVVCLKLRIHHTGNSRSTSLATVAYHSSQRSLPPPRGEYVSVRRTEEDDREATSSGQGPVRDVSPEGLIYVTIDHSKTRQNSGKRKSEKVTYATLDPINTGKYTVSEIASDKEYVNIRVP